MPSKERDADRQRRVMQAHERRRLRPGTQSPVDPRQLGGAEVPGGTGVEPGVRGDDCGLRVLDRVRERPAAAQVRSPAELREERLRVIVIAGHQMHGHRAAPHDGVQGGVLVRAAGVSQVAGDDDAVGPGRDGQQAADRLGQARGGLSRERPGHQVGVAELGDPHEAEPSNARPLGGPCG
jgi:hypothetical protein